MANKFKVYEVYNRDLLLSGSARFITEIGSTKRDVQRWVKFGRYIPTHMGELRKHADGYIYYTTIGKTFFFKREVSHAK